MSWQNCAIGQPFARVPRRFERIFPPPYQRWLDAQALSIEALQSIDNEVLIIHGRDDRVVDPQSSWHLHQHLTRSQLHYIGRCGH